MQNPVTDGHPTDVVLQSDIIGCDKNRLQFTQGDIVYGMRKGFPCASSWSEH